MLIVFVEKTKCLLLKMTVYSSVNRKKRQNDNKCGFASAEMKNCFKMTTGISNCQEMSWSESRDATSALTFNVMKVLFAQAQHLKWILFATSSRLLWEHFIGIFILCLMYRMSNNEQRSNGTVDQWYCFQSKWRGIRLISNTSSVSLLLGFPPLSGSNCCTTHQAHKPLQKTSISRSTELLRRYESDIILFCWNKYISKSMHYVISQCAGNRVSTCNKLVQYENRRKRIEFMWQFSVYCNLLYTLIECYKNRQ